MKKRSSGRWLTPSELCECERAEADCNTLSFKEVMSKTSKHNHLEDRLYLIEPTKMVVGERTYRVLSYLPEDGSQNYIGGEEMLSRAEEIANSLEREDCQHLLDHDDDIPSSMRQFMFLFTKFRDGDQMAVVHCKNNEWTSDWFPIKLAWNEDGRVLSLI